MKKILSKLGAAWSKIWDYTPPKNQIYLERHQECMMRKDYQLNMQFNYIASRHFASVGMIPTRIFEVRHLDGSELSDQEMDEFNKKLNTIEPPKTGNENQFHR